FSEMTVVRNEFERGENSPEQILSQRIYATAFEWHNYGKSTIGNRSDIERVPIESLRAFYRKFYQPDNIMLAVAGKFEDNQALEPRGRSATGQPGRGQRHEFSRSGLVRSDGERPQGRLAGKGPRHADRNHRKSRQRRCDR